MATAPTPSRADTLIREHRASMHPETLRAWASDAVDELGRQRSAERTLQRLGYQDRGGQEWAPPIGQPPDFDLIDSLRSRIAELEARKPLPLIASREVISDGPVRVTRLHLTEEGRAALTSKAAGPLPGITGGSS